MTLTIRTDHKWKAFQYRDGVPAKILASEFDWLSEDDGGLDGFFCYRGVWYHLSQFLVSSGLPKPWHGIHNDTYFSGVAIEISKDGEQYRVATVYS